MRKDITIAAQPRESRGKNEARRLRVQRLSPAVLYGSGKDAVAVSVSPKDITKILHSSSGHNTIFNLDVQGVENTPAMIVDWQRDPVREHLLHADFKRIDLTMKIRVTVPVHLTGEPKGVKLQGGVVEVVKREIEIECLPDDIPEHFTSDISEMMKDEALRAGDIPMPDSVKLVSNPSQVIVHVVGHKEEVVAAPADAAAPVAAAEPEVLKKGKKEEAAPEPEKGKKK